MNGRLIYEDKEKRLKAGSVISKLNNWTLLQKDKRVASSLPETLPFSMQNLQAMLKRYPILYLKPDNSCQGKGAMRIDKLPGGRYVLRSRDTKEQYTFRYLIPLYIEIQKTRMNRPYLIQQGIVSQTPSGEMVDIRVHLVRTKHGWRTAGMAARIASITNVVTNRSSGGQPIHLDELFLSHLSYTPREFQQKVEELNRLAHRAVRLISARYPAFSEFGVDIGMDPNGKLWIYEVNIRPSLRMFKQLNDPVYRHLIRFRKKAWRARRKFVYFAPLRHMRVRHAQTAKHRKLA